MKLGDRFLLITSIAETADTAKRARFVRNETWCHVQRGAWKVLLDLAKNRSARVEDTSEMVLERCYVASAAVQHWFEGRTHSACQLELASTGGIGGQTPWTRSLLQTEKLQVSA